MSDASESDANGDRKTYEFTLLPGSSTTVQAFRLETGWARWLTELRTQVLHACPHTRVTQIMWGRQTRRRACYFSSLLTLWETHSGVSANTVIGIIQKRDPRQVALKDPGSQHERSRLESRHTKAKTFRLSELTSTTHNERKSSAHSASRCHLGFR